MPVLAVPRRIAPSASVVPVRPVDPAAIELVAENARRWTRLRYAYDARTGEGSHEPRRALQVLPADYDGPRPDGIPDVVHLPVPMFEADGPERNPGVAQLLADIEAAGSLAAYAASVGMLVDAAWAVLSVIRVRMDFEFWAATCVKIKGDAGGSVAFVLRHPQRLYLRVLLGMLWAGAPINVVLLKARQWGGSTLTQVFFAWIQTFHREGWNSAIVADVQAQAGHILQMFEGLAAEHPEPVQKLTLRPYARMQTVRRVVERDCYIGVGSVKEPDAVRSYTFHLLHLSEVGLWESTPKQSADALAQSLIGGLASGRTDLPCSGCVMESTAKGVGTFFHAEYIAAEKGESDRTAFFLPWYEIEKYSVPIPVLDGESSTETAARFFASFDTYERYLWDTHSCTLEQILWYRKKLLGFRGRRFMMNSENPTTALEAFQSTGNRYYTAEAVAQARRSVKRPLHRGALRAPMRSGAASLTGLRLVPNELGPLQVWRLPRDGYGGLVPTGTDGRPLAVRHRYVLFYDPGGKGEKADYSVAVVVDRAPILWGGRPEVVAVWRGHMRPDLAAWSAAQLGSWYSDAGEAALLAVEVNRYRKGGDAERGLEPEWAITTIEEIGDVYTNMYYRQKQGRADDPFSTELGFVTTSGTKEMLVQALDKYLEEDLLVLRSSNSCDELDVFELAPDGRFGARIGCHDDEAIATMGAGWLAMDYDRIGLPEVARPSGPTKKRASPRPSRI